MDNNSPDDFLAWIGCWIIPVGLIGFVLLMLAVDFVDRYSSQIVIGMLGLVVMGIGFLFSKDWINGKPFGTTLRAMRRTKKPIVLPPKSSEEHNFKAHATTPDSSGNGASAIIDLVKFGFTGIGLWLIITSCNQARQPSPPPGKPWAVGLTLYVVPDGTIHNLGQIVAVKSDRIIVASNNSSLLGCGTGLGQRRCLDEYTFEYLDVKGRNTYFADDAGKSGSMSDYYSSRNR